MTRFLFRIIPAIPVWLAYFAIQIPLMLIGVPLVFVLAWYTQWRSKYWTPANRIGLLHFPKPFGLPLFWLWDNDEDGIDGDPIGPDGVEGDPKNQAWFDATAHWHVWQRVFVWSAWRNSVGNARFTRLLGMSVNPKAVAISLPDPSVIRPARNNLQSFWQEYRKLGPYLARQGWRFELRFPWPAWLVAFHEALPVKRFFWCGWRIAQQDAPNTNVGFAFQPWAKL